AWNGQTPGKRAFEIRVVGDGGVPARPPQILVRNLLRFVDGQFGYAVGIIAIFASAEEKRLGDLAAGTIVVSERRRAPQVAVPMTPNARGRALDPELLDVVRDYWRRAPQLDQEARARLSVDVGGRLAQGLGQSVTGTLPEKELWDLTKLVFEDAE
ncbi:MAG: RDD family protein, partial [Gemmatimonadetes bacterium]|nr:RDD family protein [Gemmatimonadota bacterium]